VARDGCYARTDLEGVADTATEGLAIGDCVAAIWDALGYL
jgi:hypothetical protein